MSEILTQTAPKVDKTASGLKVMVADPMPESRALLKGALRSLNNVESVAEAGTTASLGDILIENPVGVVFIEQDFGWDEIGQLIRLVKSQPESTKTNFVLTSGNMDMESRRLGIENGILGYLGKPFDIKSLEMAIRDSMGKVATNHKDTLNRVRKIEFFRDFSDLDLVRLLKICHTRKYNSEEYIFHEGEIGDRLFVLVSGGVDIRKKRDEGSETLVSLKPGDCFGEMALVDSEPRSADAISTSDAMVIEVNSEIINDINDILALKIYRKLAILVTKKLRDYTK